MGQKTGRRGGLLIGALAAAAIGAPAALFPVAGDVSLFAGALGLLVLCGTITGLVTSVALMVFIPNEARGLAIGLFIAIAGVVGYGVAPTLVAGVSRVLGGEAHLAPALALVGVVMSAACRRLFGHLPPHASFTRAFSCRYGVPPTSARRAGMEITA